MNDSQRPHASVDCYIRYIHPWGFRFNEWALIVDVRIVIPKKGDEPRPCYVVIFPDMVKDFIPLEDSKNFEIGDPLLKEETP